MKTCKLTRKNWNIEFKKKDEIFFRHKFRKKVVLIYNKNTKKGYFKDTKTQKVFSPIKIITWKKEGK